jgi:hypothetical protein
MFTVQAPALRPPPSLFAAIAPAAPHKPDASHAGPASLASHSSTVTVDSHLPAAAVSSAAPAAAAAAAAAALGPPSFSVLVLPEQESCRDEDADSSDVDEMSVFQLLLAHRAARESGVEKAALVGQVYGQEVAKQVQRLYPQFRCLAWGQLNALFTNQLLEHPELQVVWDELLSAGTGEDIYLKRPMHYLAPAEVSPLTPMPATETLLSPNHLGGKNSEGWCQSLRPWLSVHGYTRTVVCVEEETLPVTRSVCVEPRTLNASPVVHPQVKSGKVEITFGELEQRVHGCGETILGYYRPSVLLRERGVVQLNPPKHQLVELDVEKIAFIVISSDDSDLDAGPAPPSVTAPLIGGA